MTSLPKARITLGPCQFPYRSGQSCHCKAGICLALLGNDMSGRRCDNCDHMLTLHEDYIGEPGEIRNSQEYRVQGDNPILTPSTEIPISNNSRTGTSSSPYSRKRQTSRAQSTQVPAATASPSPAPAKEKLVHDAVIRNLALRANNDPQLKALMRIVASDKASQEQLSAFQVHLDEISAMIANDEAGQGPSTGVGNLS